MCQASVELGDTTPITGQGEADDLARNTEKSLPRKKRNVLETHVIE